MIMAELVKPGNVKTLNVPGTLFGVGNANPISLESYQQPQRKAWKGRCLVVIKSESKKGDILLKASSDDIKPAVIIVHSDIE